MHTRYAPVRHSQSPEGDFTVRLACIRPAASVHPEPGSNSSLYYCLSCFFSESRVPPRCSLWCSFLKRFLASRRFAAALVLCWPQTFNELSAPPSLLSTPLSRGKRVQKYNLFPNRQAVFSSFFQKSFISLIVSGKNFRIFRSRTDFWGCLGENKGKIERFFGEVVGVNGRFFGKNVPLMTKNSRDSGPAKRIHLINI